MLHCEAPAYGIKQRVDTISLVVHQQLFDIIEPVLHPIHVIVSLVALVDYEFEIPDRLSWIAFPHC